MRNPRRLLQCVNPQARYFPRPSAFDAVAAYARSLRQEDSRILLKTLAIEGPIAVDRLLDELADELARVRARGWALADEDLAGDLYEATQSQLGAAGLGGRPLHLLAMSLGAMVAILWNQSAPTEQVQTTQGPAQAPTDEGGLAKAARRRWPCDHPQRPRLDRELRHLARSAQANPFIGQSGVEFIAPARPCGPSDREEKWRRHTYSWDETEV